MITPKKIQQEYKFEHFTPDGVSLGFLNQLEHNDLRIQICAESTDGYYFLNKNDICPIDSDGKIGWDCNYPKEWDINGNQICDLFQVQKNKENNESNL